MRRAKTTHVSNLDILRSAKLLIEQYGEAASFIAAQRADSLLANGDMDGRRTWIAIFKALEEITRTTRAGGEALH